jgi:hypothetical protein
MIALNIRFDGKSYIQIVERNYLSNKEMKEIMLYLFDLMPLLHPFDRKNISQMFLRVDKI